MKIGNWALCAAVAVGLASTLVHCTSSSFGGQAGKVANPPAAANATTPSPEDAAPNGPKTNAGNSAGTTDPSTNTGGSGGSPTNPILASNPCGANSSGSAAATPKNSLLFYAPADYTATGGPEGTQNTYLNEVQAYLQAHGYTITVVNAVTQVPGNFNPCTLYQSYTQIWMWLPCNNAQLMGATSMSAIQAFYNYGGPVALFTDNHYFSEGEPNTHCDAANWAGATGSPSDAVAFAQFLGATLNYGSLAGMSATGTTASGSTTASSTTTAGTASSTASSLAQVWAGLQWTTFWGMISIGSPLPAHATVLPMTAVPSQAANGLAGALGGAGNGVSGLTTGATYGVLIETPATATAMPKEAVIFTPSYAFHFASGVPADTGYKALADYFETKVDAITVNGTATASAAVVPAPAPAAAFGSQAALALTSRESLRPATFNPANYRASAPARPAYELRLDLNSPHKEAVVMALKGLAEQGELTADDLVPFLDHPQYIVRLTANIAARSVPRADILGRLLTVLHTPDHSTNLTISAARSLAAIAGWEGLPDLQQALTAETDPLAKSELQLAINDLSALSQP